MKHCCGLMYSAAFSVVCLNKGGELWLKAVKKKGLASSLVCIW